MKNYKYSQEYLNIYLAYMYLYVWLEVKWFFKCEKKRNKSVEEYWVHSIKVLSVHLV